VAASSLRDGMAWSSGMVILAMCSTGWKPVPRLVMAGAGSGLQVSAYCITRISWYVLSLFIVLCRLLSIRRSYNIILSSTLQSDQSVEAIRPSCKWPMTYLGSPGFIPF